MEASTLRPAATLPKPRITVGAPLLRLRTDDQLVALFRAGHEEAFHAIHDRYNRRLFAYARQMLPGRQDAEDVLQDVFVRAYAGLRASERGLALRPWLFRVAHNRCVDQLRKPHVPPAEVLQLVRSPALDPLAEVDLRESLRRLVDDIRRLPDQQRSALLMRELAGLSYAEIATSLGVSVGAVKSLLVRARISLAQASEARETACAVIREELVDAHDRGIRPNATARRHMRDCSCCKSFRRELRGVSRQLAAVAPAVGPLGFIANVLGFSGGGGAAGSAGSGAALLSGGGTTASAGGLALGTGHVATLIVAAVATAGGTVAIQRTLLPAPRHAPKVHVVAVRPKLSTPAAPAQIIRPDAAGADSREAPALIADGYAASPAAPARPRAGRREKATETTPAASKRLSVAKSRSAAALGTPTGSSLSSCGTTPATSSAGGGATTSTAASGSSSSLTTASTTTSSGTTGSGTAASSTGASATGSSSASTSPATAACGAAAGAATSASGSSSSSSSSSSTTQSSGSGAGGTASTSSSTDSVAGSGTGEGSSAPSSNTTSG